MISIASHSATIEVDGETVGVHVGSEVVLDIQFTVSRANYEFDYHKQVTARVIAIEG